MKTMNVMRFNDFSDAPALIAGTAPVPQPGRGGMLIRVHAAGTNAQSCKRASESSSTADLEL
jgi:hypothetical protein